jgi:outer membrane protein OmpA-like peptidoglycan-associated protein
MRLLKLLVCCILSIFIIIGCGGPPEDNPLLKEARSSFQEAEKDSVIVTNAPVALKEAEEALQESEQLWKEKADEELVDHHAYIAKQKVAIAREVAELNAAQDEVERAESQRQQVLIKARKAEAIAAEKRAEEALSRAEKERREAEKARKRAEGLAERVNKLEAERTERGLVLTLGDVLFDFDKYDLKETAKKSIEDLAGRIASVGIAEIIVQGHTDSDGSYDYNLLLSENRAESVLRRLNENLMDSGIYSFKTEAYGESRPRVSNETAENRQLNRRVEIVVLPNKDYYKQK